MSKRPVFDAHVDSLQLALDVGRDLAEAGAGHLDLERAEQGGLGSVVLVCWCDPKYIERDEARVRTTLLLRELHALARRVPERVGIAGNARVVDDLHESKRLAAIAGIEGGHSIEESLDVLRTFFDHGVRVLTLVWNNHLSWIRSCQPDAGTEVPEGLSDFGRDVVREMNRLGMVVDVSHAGERAVYDVLDVSSKPVIASHSGCKAIHDHPRNLDDEQLRAIAAAGGVVGIVFCTAFLDRAAGVEDRRVRILDEYKALTGKNDTELFLLQSRFLQSNARPLPCSRVIDHIVHAVEVAGVEHVGIGSDFDGIQRTPQGLEDASCYWRIGEALLRRGLDESDVRMILGGNMERVFAEVTGHGTVADRAEIVALD